MKLHEVLKTQIRSNKRVGRGLGSGKGKTGGRGTKGQKARGKIPATFTGSLSLYRKLPLSRGKGNNKVSVKPVLINLNKLNIFKSEEVVDIQKLLDAKVVSEKQAKIGVKILGKGEIKNAITIKLPVSDSARKIIEKAGGKVENG